MSEIPKAWIGVTELDILRDEAIQYRAKLSTVGTEVEIDLYKGAPHSIKAMDDTRCSICILDNCLAECMTLFIGICRVRP